MMNTIMCGEFTFKELRDRTYIDIQDLPPEGVSKGPWLKRFFTAVRHMAEK